MQPSDAKGRLICPVCFQPIPLGNGVIRGTDDLSVHQDCHDRVMSWRPAGWPVDNALDSRARPICPLCGESIADHDGFRLFGYMVHDECWPTADCSAVRIHVSAADWEHPAWRDSFEVSLEKMGWSIVAVERGASADADIVYVAVMHGANDPASRR
jgi:hypothetical protein